mmetsp:Transcript_11471/g.20304  ORF Transcript_11471/g.20304 Transcript_11471/m.20304 type:complete len:221 (-) Transcript_11471:585-1247(-)
MQEAFVVNRFCGFLFNFCNVLLAQTGISVVTHHDVAASVAQLTLFVFGRMERILCPRCLGLNVYVVLVHMEDTDLGSSKGLSHRAELEAFLDVAGCLATALGHTIGVHDSNTETSKVTLQVSRHWRSTCDGIDTCIETECLLNFVQYFFFCKVIHRRFLSSAPNHAIVEVLGSLSLCKCGYLLLESLGSCSSGAHLLGNLLPYAGYTEECGRSHCTKAVS